MNRSRKTADLSCIFNGITDPRRGNDAELERISVIEQVGKGVATRPAVLQIHEPKQESLLDFAEFDCIGAYFASRHDGQKNEKRNLERFLRGVRQHWSAENSPRWFFDVTMNEDHLRNRTGKSSRYAAAVSQSGTGH